MLHAIYFKTQKRSGNKTLEIATNNEKKDKKTAYDKECV